MKGRKQPVLSCWYNSSTPLSSVRVLPYLRAACSVRGELVRYQAGEPERSQMVNNVPLVHFGDCLRQRLRAAQDGRCRADTTSVRRNCKQEDG